MFESKVLSFTVQNQYLNWSEHVMTTVAHLALK